MKTLAACKGCLTAFLISTALLAGCENTHFSDTSPERGDPLIVWSDVAVKVTRFSDAVSSAGGRLETKNIKGWATMPRGTYADMLAEMDRAMAAVTRANEAIAQAEERVAAAKRGNEVERAMARVCAADQVCAAAARPHIARIVEGQKK